MTATATDFPITPYAGTSGWSGSETSEARAVRRDESGDTASQQEAVYNWLLNSRLHFGATFQETMTFLSDLTGDPVHHGTASSVLSNLHKEGLIARVGDVRDNCKIYVHPQFIDGRTTEKQGRDRLTVDEREFLARVKDQVVEGTPVEDHDVFGLIKLVERLA
jgi:hypothetical protein